MKKALIIIALSAQVALADTASTNNINTNVLPPAHPQCPPSDRPGWHQKADGTWVRN